MRSGGLGFRQGDHSRVIAAVLSSVMVTAVQGARLRRALRGVLSVAVISFGLTVSGAAIAPSLATAAPGAPGPDVTVTIESLTDPVQAGRQARLHVVVSNVGDDVATDTSLALIVPAGLLATALAPSACDVGTLTCAIGDLLPNEPIDVYLDVDVDASLLGPVVVEAFASTTATQPTGDLPDSMPITLDVVANVDVSVLVEATSTTATAGETAAFDIRVATTGSSSAMDVRIDVPLPAGATVASTSAPAICTPQPASLSCAIGAMPPYVPLLIHVVVDLAASLADGASLVFESSLSTSSLSDDPSNNRSNTSVTVGRVADLQLDATASTAIAGSSGSFTLKVTNNGPSDAADVIVRDDLPPGFTPLAVDRAECSIVDDLVACHFGTLVATAHRAVVITGVVHADQPAAPLVNTPLSTTTSNDPTPASVSASMIVERQADVSISKTGGATAIPGVPGAATWEVVVHNAGPSSATSVTVVDTLPSSVSLVGVSGACSVLSCNIGVLQPGDDATILVTGTVDAGFGSGIDSVTNVADISASAEPDLSTDDWHSSDAVITTPRAALVVTTAAPSTVVAGTGITWTVHVVNLGPSWARSVSVVDPRPAGLSGFVSVSGACSVLPCLVGDLAPGATADLSISATVAPSYSPLTITKVASVTSTTAGSTGDLRSSSVETTVTKAADIEVFDELVGVVRAGDVAHFRVTVINHGPSDSGAVTVATPTPSASTFVSAHGPLGPCAGSPCGVGTVPAGQLVALDVALAINAGLTSETMTHAASASMTTADPGFYENSASVTANVVLDADLVLSISPAGPVVPGRPAALTATVHNSGPSNAVGPVVRLTLPEQLTNSSIVGSAGVCTISGLVASCNLPSIASGADAVVVVNGELASDVVGALTIAGTVSARTHDPNLSNNTVSSTIATAPVADVTVVFDAGGGLVAGSVTSVLALVTNLGPSMAHDVIVHVELPADVVLVDAPTAFDDPTPCAVLSHVVTCSVGSVLVGIPTPVLLPVRIASGFQGIAALPATVSTSSDQQGATGNDHVEGLLAVGIVADLALEQTSPSTAEFGDSVTYHLSTSNRGPSTAVNVELVYTLPMALVPVAAESNVASCAIDGQTITCGVDRLELRETMTIDIRATVRAKGRLLSTATVHSDSTDVLTSNNVASAVLDIVRYADLRVVNTVDRASAAVGEELVYRIVVSNYGPDDADGIVAIIDSIAGLRLVTAEATQGLFDRGTMRWTVGALQNGSTAVLTIRSTVAATGLLLTRVRIEANVVDAFPASDVDEVGVIVAGDRLPATGASIDSVVRFGTVFMVAGLLVLVAARRRQRLAAVRPMP
jgi:uncharacterized repeat protein (TIGR01451 family)